MIDKMRNELRHRMLTTEKPRLQVYMESKKKEKAQAVTMHKSYTFDRALFETYAYDRPHDAPEKLINPLYKGLADKTK